MRVQFTKMHGLGNDFVVIDAVSQHVNLRASQIQKLANRHTGIGFDQLLLIEPPSRPDADFDYRILILTAAKLNTVETGHVALPNLSPTEN
jgi:diaminopimelate epimerase